MSYLVPTGRLSAGERNAIRSVSGLMEEADEAQEDLALQQEANREEDREWAETHDGSEEISASTRRILDQYNENRQRGVDISDDYYLAETDADAEALAGHTGNAAEREAKAAASVAKILRIGVVEHDDDEDDEGQSAPPVDDYRRWDDFHREDFPSTAAPPRPVVPEPATPAEEMDDGYGEDRGPYAGPRLASSPPVWIPPDQR